MTNTMAMTISKINFNINDLKLIFNIDIVF